MESTPRAPVTSEPRPPIFTSIAGVMVFVCLTTPIIMLSTPVAITIAAAVAAWFRREKFRWAAAIAFGIAILLMFAGSSHLNPATGTSTEDMSKAQIADWSWESDPSTGSNGMIRWRVAVKNLSDRPMESVKVNLSTYDAAGKLLGSDFAFVDAIPPGETRTSEGIEDRYGTEQTAQTLVSDVRYSDEE